MLSWSILVLFFSILILLGLILYFKIHPFLSLLITCMVLGLGTGLDAPLVLETIQKGMGGTLGFVATVVGLGALFGGILEASGGAQSLVFYLLKLFGKKNTPTAMLLTGFFVAIPVFFDVAFIILLPVIYTLQKQTRQSLLLFALPLLAGLAITHAFIPPTPGPIAVADILGADLGWVILLGFCVGLPTAIISGLIFGKYAANRLFIEAPPTTVLEENKGGAPPVFLILLIIISPIGLILLATFLKSGILPLSPKNYFYSFILFLGHPFSALTIANLMAWYFLGKQAKFSKETLFKISQKSLIPAGSIILVTGAGGAFKQILVDTGTGKLLATALSDFGLPLLVFAFLSALLVRVIQGSATVAMITAAGLLAPLLESGGQQDIELASLVIAIAAGASGLSHVNDSGFWLVSQYLGLSEQETLKTWTVMTTLLAFSSFILLLLLQLVL